MKKRVVIIVNISIFLIMSICFSTMGEASKVSANPIIQTENKIDDKEKEKESGLLGSIGGLIEDIIGALGGNTDTPKQEPTVEPSAEATEEATVEPSAEVTVEPTVEATEEVTVEPSAEATVEPSAEATVEPTPEVAGPTIPPTMEETGEATPSPTLPVTQEPTVEPSVEPSPTAIPTEEPTIEPTVEVTEVPTEEPTVEPTVEVTEVPTEEPTVEPTVEVTEVPTEEPTIEPTIEPTPEPTPEPKRDIASQSIVLSGVSYTYTGSRIKPFVYVSGYDSSMLYEGIDYTLEYYNNIMPGTATIKITGIGERFEGTTTRTFTIKPVSISGYTITLSNNSYYYTGVYKTPTVTIKNYVGTKLVQNVDYTVKYTNNYAPGTATAKVTGKGLYEGTLSKTYKIIFTKVSNFKVIGRNTSAVKMSWNYYSGATGYLVQRYDSAKKKYVNIENIQSSRTCTYMNTGLASATVYTYRVQPYVVYNGKYYYGEVTSSLKGATRPVATKISLSAGKKYATVKWNKVNRASGYEIYMATPGGTYKHIATKGSSVKSYKKTKLTSKKYYYFVVRPYVLENGVRIYGSYSPAKYVKVK